MNLAPQDGDTSDEDDEEEEADRSIPHMDAAMCTGADSIQVQVCSAVKAGREIFNTYGEFGNAELLNKYGFVVPGNPFDAIEVDHGATVNVLQAAGLVSARQMRRRLMFMSGDVAEESGLTDMIQEHSDWRPHCEMPKGLAVLIFFCCMDEDKFMRWQSMDVSALNSAVSSIDGPTILGDPLMRKAALATVQARAAVLDEAMSAFPIRNDTDDAVLLSLASLRQGEQATAQWLLHELAQ